MIPLTFARRFALPGRRSLRHLLLLCCLSVGVHGLAANKTPGESHPIIDQIGPELHDQHIDYRATYARGPAAVGRPTLAPLEGFPSEVHEAGQSQFDQELARGSTGVVAAVEPVGTKRSRPSLADFTDDQFADQWFKAPPERRVFIAFTREDFVAAQAVRAQLQAKGFNVHLYINDLKGEPRYSASRVGTVYRTAGHHLVIDSPAARKSPAVAYEAYWYTTLPPVDRRFNVPAVHSRPALATCWECCTYRDGIPLGCSPLGCGEEARQRGELTCQ